MSGSKGTGKKAKIKESALQGFKDLRAMRGLLGGLHKIGTDRDKAGNRKLHMDDYCLLVLMWLYNPVIDSLRGLSQTTHFDSVRKRLGVGRASLGSLSESVSIFDPERLAELADEMSRKLPDRTPEKFNVIDKKITAVDGSIFQVLAQIAKLAWLPYVCRLRDKSPYTVVSGNELSNEAVAQEIVSDQIVQFGTANSRTTPPDHRTRLVIVKVTPHDSRRRKNAQSGPSSDGYLRIVTNNLEAPAEIIASLYELRWTIELYFRTIKQLFGCRHLLSTKPEGVEIQIYMAIIACIMILSITGKTPTKRTYEMICFYLLGWASLEELEEHIRKLKTNNS
jgi:IS4 transposase